LTITHRSEILRSKVKAVSALKIFEEAMHCWLSMLGEGWGEYIREGTEKENEKHIAQGVVLKFQNHSADTRHNDTFSEKVSVCLVGAKLPLPSTLRLPNVRRFSRGSDQRRYLLAWPDVAGLSYCWQTG